MGPANGANVNLMLSHQEAFEKIIENSLPLKPEWVGLRESPGLTTAQDIFSPEPYPNFDNSAVDGYAIALPLTPALSPMGRGEDEGVEKTKFRVKGEVKAGECFSGILKSGEAMRIFTGAPVPQGAQAVVMQEHTKRANGTLRLLKTPKTGENIRFRGEDFKKGRILIRKGTTLQAAHLALLAAVGIPRIFVYPSPGVAILATGTELWKKGRRLPQGKIRDSNTILLEALVKQAGGIPLPLPSVGDDLREIRRAIRKGLQSDLLIISGGVSVGKYDFVKEALKKEGVREIFWKVDIKPGKPLYFGKKNHTLVFGLPGNPVSVFVTFEEFVKPAIQRMSRRAQAKERRIQGKLTEKFQNGGRLQFVRVRCSSVKRGFKIFPLKGQGSHRIGELASAHALLRVEPNAVLKKGQRVSVKMINEDLLL